MFKSGEALLPAAQMTLVDGTNSSPIFTPFSRTSLTRLFSLTVTPIRARAVEAFAERSSLNPGKMRGLPSTSKMHMSSSRKEGKSGPIAFRPISASAPANSTPVGPPPTITKVSGSCVPVAARRRSASSKADSIFSRSPTASVMLRALLLRLADREHILLLVTHHIASDGWSSGILWRELGNLYGAFSRSEPDPLPELPIQYADYAIWQRQWLQGESLETQLSYWRKQLNGVAALQLPTDRPRPALQSFRGAKKSLVLSVDLSEALNNLSRREGVTLFMRPLSLRKRMEEATRKT